MPHSQNRLQELNALKAERKTGEIGVVAYYKGLLAILSQVIGNLTDEDISKEEARKQTPLVLVFLEEQLGTLKVRGG